jgi:hypothetical protein
MPADCVKTRIELSAVKAPGGLLPDLALFFGTARAMLADGGVGALFRGMGPRLADKVPSTMVSCCLPASAILARTWCLMHVRTISEMQHSFVAHACIAEHAREPRCLCKQC